MQTAVGRCDIQIKIGSEKFENVNISLQLARLNLTVLDLSVNRTRKIVDRFQNPGYQNLEESMILNFM